ncbi:MAG TPA: HlyD family efflux transporter periplasmic adaptor subunit [Cytophagales bacterium]|nr:HlyD family efflux transporter periplasmic adaptor subunit [Cytophagales bacterium]
MKYVIVTISALLLLLACSKSSNERVHPVIKDITETVFASGILDPEEKYNLTAQSDGYLVHVDFKDGDMVHSNQVLVVVDNKTNTANAQASSAQLKIATFNTTENAPALRQLQANIEFATQKLKQDQTQVQRYKALFESNSIAKIEYENVLLTAHNSEASLKALKEQYQALKQQAEQQKIIQQASHTINWANTDFNKIRALTGGKILKRYKQTGDYVKRGDIIATIGNPNTMMARINIDENSISKVKVGQKAAVKLNVHKDRTYEGKIAEILPMFDEATQSFVCKIAFDKPLDFTISGTQLEANIVVNEKKQVLLIPRNYLGFGNKVQVKGKDTAFAIKTGIVSTEWVEVLHGLSVNDELEPLKP